jgi:hypothetical protein
MATALYVVFGILAFIGAVTVFSVLWWLVDGDDW